MAKAAILTRLESQLRAKGMSASKAKAMALQKMQQAGNVNSDGSPTAKGAKRGRMGADGRAKDRAAKKSGRSTTEYGYNPETNRATLKSRGKKKASLQKRRSR